jgi:acetoacetate decarboxylase
MGFVKSKEELDSYYGLRVRNYYDAEMLAVMFETGAKTAQGLLPPPLDIPESPGGTIFIARYGRTNLGPGYREAGLFLRCRYGKEAGSYCLSMPVDGEEARIYNGRDIFGFPKKKASIHLERSGNNVSGWIERHGIRFVEIRVTITGTIPQLPPQAPNFTFKGMPRIDLTPGFDGPVFLCRQQTAIEAKKVEIGTGEVDFGESEHDPWHEIEITRVQAGVCVASDNTLHPGTVITQVDGDRYLPFYYRMTDFHTGG